MCYSVSMKPIVVSAERKLAEDYFPYVEIRLQMGGKFETVLLEPADYLDSFGGKSLAEIVGLEFPDDKV